MMNTTASAQLSRSYLLAMLFVGALASVTGAARAAEYEELETLNVEQILPPEFLHSAAYDFEPLARASGNFYRYQVHTDATDYRITSTAMLRIRLHEIETIAQLEARLEQSENDLARVQSARRGVGADNVLDILTDPMGTATHLLGNIEYNVEQTFGDGVPTDTPGTPARASQDLNPDPHKRSAAAQLGVDVYSSNMRLQRLLNTLADARSAGKTAASFSPLIRNQFAEAPFGTGLLNARLESHLKNVGSADIHAEIDGALHDLGIAPKIRIAFLTHPAYTPRTRLYFTSYVDLLGEIDDVERLFKAANAARTEADALAYVNYARMLAYHQLQNNDLTAVVTEARFPTLESANNAGVLALPVDYLVWSETVAAAADTLHEMRQTRDLDAFTVLLAGSVSARAQNELAARKVKVLPRYSY